MIVETKYSCADCSWKGEESELAKDEVESCMGTDEIEVCPQCGSMELKRIIE